MSTYLVTASLLAACSPGGQENQSGQDQAQADQDQDQLQVTASFFPVYEFAREVAGDRAQVDMILSSNQDAHSFEPSPQDIAQVDQSDVFVYSSDEMEFWAGDLLEAVENEDLVVAKAIDGMDGDLASGHDHEHDEDDHDHEHDEDDHDHDHGAESDDFIGLAGHYHTGDTAGLQANVDTDQDVTWFVEQDGQVIEEETLAHDETFEYSIEDTVEVYYQVDGEESDRVELHVDNHGGDGHDHDHDEDEHDHDEDDHDHDEDGHDHDEDDHDHDEDDHDEDEHDHDEDDHDHDEDEHDHDEDDHDHDEDDHDEDEHDHDEDDHDHDEDDHDHDDDQDEESNDFIGLAGHYHTGDTASLQANTESDQDVTWFVEQDGQVIEEETLAHDEAFEHTLEDSVEVYYQVDGEESDRVELHVDDHEDLDPHIWLDPVYAQDQVNAIRDAFIEADPEGEEVYTQNAADFNKQLEELHQEYSQAFENAENRNFVVQHEAFGYLANRYDLNQVSIGGLSTEVEPSPARIAEVGDLVEEYQVPVIYYQEGADSSAAQTVADETGTDIAELYDLEILSDEMQAENLSYLDVMERNLEQLKLSIQ